MQPLTDPALGPLQASIPGESKLVPIRVCFVIDNLSRAGTEMQLLNLFHHFDRAKLIPYLCLLDGLGAVSRTLEPPDVPTLRLGVKRCASRHAIRQAIHFWKYLISNNIDVVQTYFTDSTRFAVPIASAAGVKAVVASHRNIGHWSSRKDAWIGRVYCRLFLDCAIANCEAAAHAAVKHLGASLEKLRVIPNGIDLDPFRVIPAWTTDTAGEPRRVGMVGNLRHVKGVDTFIAAADLILRRRPDTLFDIAGGGDPSIYQRLANDLGIHKQVRLVGAHADIPRFLAKLDIAVLSSRAEGMSNAILEYMAAGRPIVATNVGGNSELIESPDLGVLVRPDSPSDLAEAVLTILACPERAKAIAINAQQHVRAKYNICITTDRLINVYQELCAHKHAAASTQQHAASLS